MKVHLPRTDYPKVTQVTGMFYTRRARIHILWPCWVQHCANAVFVSLFVDGLTCVEEIKLNKCIYIEDTCLERLSSIENLQKSLYMMEVVSCGNVTDKGVVALHKLKWVLNISIYFIHFVDIKRSMIHQFHYIKK